MSTSEDEELSLSKRRKLAIEGGGGEVGVNSPRRSGGDLTSDAHLSGEKIQAFQLAKQPFNIWGERKLWKQTKTSKEGKDEPDSAEVDTPGKTSEKDEQGENEPVNDEPDSSSGLEAVTQATTHSIVSRGIPSPISHVLTGRGTTVAILDSGINVHHSAFRNEDGKILQYSKSFVGGDYTDTLGHGTQCAGLLCGSPDEIVVQGLVRTLPFSGIAPSARVIVCKVVRDGTEIADVEAVCNAIDHIREFNQNCVAVDAKVDVISLSFGMTGFHHKLTKKIQEALYDSIIVVCAASNSGKKTRQPITYPARLGDVLCIGACTENGKPSDFSPFGRELDFLALGESVWAPSVGDENAYSVVNGTSFAAPLVAGVVCQVIEDLRRLSGRLPADGDGALLCESMHNVWCMRELLKEMATTAGEHSRKSGYGMLNPNEYFEKGDDEKLRIARKINY